MENETPKFSNKFDFSESNCDTAEATESLDSSQDTERHNSQQKQNEPFQMIEEADETEELDNSSSGPRSHPFIQANSESTIKSSESNRANLSVCSSIVNETASVSSSVDNSSKTHSESVTLKNTNIINNNNSNTNKNNNNIANVEDDNSESSLNAEKASNYSYSNNNYENVSASY